MKQGKSKAVAALAITILIFLSGFILGNLSLSSKIGAVQDLQNEIYTESIGFEVLFDLAENNLCDEQNIAEINYQLTDFGERLAYLEKQDADITSLKNQYNSLEIKHFLLINKINKQCRDKYDTILYFYGPASECKACLLQGLELSTIKSQNPEIMIYSFDYNSNFAPVKTLVNQYNVQTIPTLVINGKNYEEFFTRYEIVALVNSN